MKKLLLLSLLILILGCTTIDETSGQASTNQIQESLDVPEELNDCIEDANWSHNIELNFLKQMKEECLQFEREYKIMSGEDNSEIIQECYDDYEADKEILEEETQNIIDNC